MRKGAAPIIFAVFVIVFMSFVIYIMSVGGTYEYRRSTNDIAYQIPITQMELIYKFMKQSLIFSAYQASAELLESGALGTVGESGDVGNYTDNYAKRDNVAAAYWYDNRKSEHENYPDYDVGTIPRTQILLGDYTSKKMSNYTKDADVLMSKIGDWSFPTFLTITTDSIGESYSYESREKVKYKTKDIEIRDINKFSISIPGLRPLIQIAIGKEGVHCFISNAHFTECVEKGIIFLQSPPSLKTQVNNCISSQRTDASAYREACGNVPVVTNQDVRNDNNLDAREDGVEQCVKNSVTNNRKTLNDKYGIINFEWNHKIEENDAKISLYNCLDDTQKVGTCLGTPEKKVFPTRFNVDAEGSIVSRGWAGCNYFNDGGKSSADHFCRIEYGSDAYSIGCYYDEVNDRYKWDENNPPQYKGVQGSPPNGVAVTKVECEKPVVLDKWRKTRSCGLRYQEDLDLTTHLIDNSSSYPYYTPIDGKGTQNRNMTLRFLVHIQETYP